MVPREPDAGQAHTGPRDDEVGTRSDRCSLDRWRGKCKVVQGGRGWEGNLEARKRESERAEDCKGRAGRACGSDLQVLKPAVCPFLPRPQEAQMCPSKGGADRQRGLAKSVVCAQNKGSEAQSLATAGPGRAMK